MTTLGQFRRSFSKVYPNLYFRVGDNKFNDKTLLSELINKNNPIVDWNEYATAAEIKYAIEAWLSLNVDFYFEKAPGSRPRFIKIEQLDLTTPLAELNKTVVEKGAVDLTYWVEDNGIDSHESIGSSMQGESRDSKGKDSSSQLDVDFSMKNVYYMTFYLYCDADGIELTESENAAEAILDKINTIISFIQDRIDKEVHGFIYDEFLTSFDTLENRSINSPDLLEFMKNKLKTASMKDSLENGESIRAAFIFDPVNDQLEVWKDEFLELSAHLEMTICISGNHYQYFDFVIQTYDNGDYDTGIIACDQEVIEDLSLNDYMKSENPDSFPSDSIFELSNYIK